MSKQSKLYSREHQVWDFSRVARVWLFIRSGLWLQPGSLATWQYEWCILSQLAQWLKIFINGDKRAGFNQNWGSIVLRHIDTNIARQDISDISDTNTQETIITSKGSHNNAHNQIVEETYQEINVETLIMNQIHQLIILFFTFYV